MQQSGMENRPCLAQQEKYRLQEQKHPMSMGNLDLEKRNFLTAAIAAIVEPASRQNSHESRRTKEQKKQDKTFLFLLWS